jgi:hypothetical protein
MTKNGPELKIWPAEPAGARADGPRELRPAPGAPAAAAVLSEEAVHLLLEATTAAELRRVLHDAAVEAARDGVCTPPEECEPPYHHSYAYEVTDASIEPSLDSVAGFGTEILD